MMKKKKLGKIKSVNFGHCGYQEAMIGIYFELTGEGWGTCTDKCVWDPNIIKCNDRCEWTEEYRSKRNNEIVRHISDLLHVAKVHSIDQLQGIPVEVTFKHDTLKEWRILKEVL